MALFRNQLPPELPIRRNQVLLLIKLGMEKIQAYQRDPNSAQYQRLRVAYDNAKLNSRLAEIHAANDALRRHGWLA